MRESQAMRRSFKRSKHAFDYPSKTHDDRSGNGSYGISVISLRENLEVLAVDEIVIVYQQIAGVFHFASDLVFLNSVTE